jgi:hypothetical protein
VCLGEVCCLRSRRRSWVWEKARANGQTGDKDTRHSDTDSNSYVVPSVQRKSAVRGTRGFRGAAATTSRSVASTSQERRSRTVNGKGRSIEARNRSVDASPSPSACACASGESEQAPPTS